MVSTTTADAFLTDFIPVQLYGSAEDLLEQCPSYSMLHSDLSISRVVLVLISLHRRIGMTSSSGLFLQRIESSWSSGAEYMTTLLMGEVTAGDIKALLQPTTLTVGLL